MQDTKKQNTKTSLLRAAERLFAERGFGNVTGKDILRAAGARNESALQYHFGDMRALMREVFDSRFQTIEEARLARFAELDANGLGHDLEALIFASVAPFFEGCLDEDGRLYARFCVQFSTDPGFNLRNVVEQMDIESMVLLRKRLLKCLDHMPEAALNTRFRLGFSISLIQVADFARQLEEGAAPPLEEAINEAAAGICGYLSTPPLNGRI
ncbi:MAG: helix-turn-helix domain-containing protein [Pseudomonadota bacterium]